MSAVIVISGPPGAGKTTAARELAARFPRGVHLHTDWFFQAIRTGFVDPWRAEAHEQNLAAVRAAAESARVFAEAGYAVIIDGVVFPWALEVYREAIVRAGAVPICVVLLPRVELTLERGPGRIREREPGEAAYRSLHRQFAESGLPTIDTSAMSPAEVVDAILAAAGARSTG